MFGATPNLEGDILILEGDIPILLGDINVALVGERGLDYNLIHHTCCVRKDVI